MSIPSAVKSTPIAGRQQLADYLAAGEKPREAWRIGTEHEKFGFRTDDLRPPTFEGERGIKRLLETLATRYGWDVAREGENPVALSTARRSRWSRPGSWTCPAHSWRRSTRPAPR
ncbi:hypothetical protein RLIN73S_00714 [Rhodanobacter lindaniclasticus]